MFVRFGIFTVIVTLLFSLSLDGQTVTDTTRNNYALLWEITGNDLSAPSYVFGSMHVRYKSVFEFPDSLLLCLKAVDAVANEIHLDSAMHRILELYVGDKEIVVDSSYLRFIREKILLPDTQQTVIATDSMTPDFRQVLRGLGEGLDLRNRGFMPTMLDAHLMEVGRRWGKKQYGLEEIDEHLYESEVEVNPGNELKFSWFGNNADELLRLYYAGDLAPIDAFIRKDPREFNQLALVARNYIMVEAMQEIMSGESLFSIVGAAHLPGEEGVLALLRKAGYHLRPVTPTFTGLRDSIRIPVIERPWRPREGQNGVFAFGTPLDFIYQHNDGANNSYFAFDIGRGVSYLLLSASMLPLDYDDFDNVFFLQDGYEIVAKAPIEHAGLSGLKYDLLKPGEELGFYRAYTFNYDQNLYYLQIGAYHEKTLEELGDVDTFLEKFDVLKKSRNKWVKVTDTLGGFQLNLPDHYVYSNSIINEAYPPETAKNYLLHQYRAGFETPMASVWCQYYDFTPGELRANEVAQLKDGLDYLQAIYGIELEVTKRDSLGGSPRWLLSGEFVDRGLLFQGQVIARANRVYLLSQVDAVDGRTTKKFLPSFALLPLRETVGTKSVELISDRLRIDLPVLSQPQIIDHHTNYQTAAKMQYQVRVTDPGTSATYLVDAFLYPSLVGIKDTLAFLEEHLAAALEHTDRWGQEEQVQLAAGPLATQNVYTTTHAQLAKKVQYYRYGRYWVLKQMIGTAEDLAGKAAQRFFNGDEWLAPPTDFNLFTERTSDLLTGLQSQDSVQLLLAYKVLSTVAELEQGDVPALRKVFLNNTWEKYELEELFLRRLIPVFLQNGEYGQQVLQQIYQEPMLSKNFREKIISILAITASKESIALLFRLLENEQPLSAQLAKIALSPFAERPSLLVTYWENLQQLFSQQQEPLYLWELTEKALALDTLEVSPIVKSQDLLVKRGRERLLNWQPEQGKKIPEVIFGLYRQLPQQVEILALAKLFYERSTVDWASLAAAGYLLEKGEKTARRKWKQFLQKDSLRVPFLRLLNEFDLLGEVGGKYYEQEAIARHLFLEELAPAGEVSDLTLLEEIEVLFRGEARRAFVFSFQLDGDTNRLGVVGFFARDPAVRNFLDEGLVNFTAYPISPRRRASKAQEMIEDLEENKDGVYPEDYPFYTPSK